MLDNIKNSDLVITPTYIKNDILKETSEKKEIINCKFMTIEEFKRKSFETYDEHSIYYLMKNYNLKYDAAKEYLDNIFLDFKDIKPYYEKLKEEKLLVNNRFFRPNNITVIGYEHIEAYLLKELNKYNVRFIKEKKEDYIHQVHEFDTETEELVYTATKIIKDLKNIDINDMYLVIPSDEYLIELSRIFTLFNIPLNIKSNQSIYSTKTARDFLSSLKETKNIEISLEKTPQNEIYNHIIDLLNKYTFIKKIDNTFIEIIESEIKKIKLKTNNIEGALKVINFKDIYDKNKYYYILGLNQNLIPKIHEEDGLIDDKTKKALGLFTSGQLNKIEKEKTIDILTHYPHVHASYKLKDNFNSYYPSSIISDLNIEVIKENQTELKYSNSYNKLLLGSMLDDYTNYNEEDQRIEILYPNYPKLQYKTYNNDYTGVDKQKIKEYLKSHLTLSYSSMNNYFLCPFKFYIQNILKLNKSEETFPILIGNLFHHILQNLYSEGFDLDTYYTDYLKNKSLTSKEMFFTEKLKNVLKEDIKVINMQDSHSSFKNRLTEKKIVIEKNQNLKTTFMGIVDKLSFLNNYVVITDYKTGNIEATLDNITDGLNLQLPAYIYLIKNGYEKDKKIVGFYLQKLLNNIIVDDKEDNKNKLKLNGYTINEETIIEKIDDTYENSEVIKGMKKTKNGFYTYTKLIKDSEIDLIENIVDKNIDKVIKAVEKADFKINPKRLNNKLISCEYCKFRDLCYRKEEDITTLTPKTFKEIVGDIDDKLD